MNHVIRLTSEGYSYHTFELKWNPSGHVFYQTRNFLHSVSAHDQFYPLNQYGDDRYFCGVLRDYGIRIYLTKTRNKYVVKLIVNPRRLIDPEASYLGIMQPDSESFELLEQVFTDCMRRVRMPEFLDDWTLSRMDLCVNIFWNKKRASHELIRLMQKEPTPAGYQKNQFKKTAVSGNRKKRQRKKFAHILKFSNDSIALVVYDKRYQMIREKLERPSEELPKSILRVELQCERKWIRRYAGKNKLQSTCGLLTSLASNSRDLIFQYASKLYNGGDYCKAKVLSKMIKEAPEIRKKSQKHMLTLAEALGKTENMEKALKKAALSQKQYRTCLQHFAALDLNFIPLKEDYYIDRVPSLLKILQLLENDKTEIRLQNSKGRPRKKHLVFFEN